MTSFRHVMFSAVLAKFNFQQMGAATGAHETMQSTGANVLQACVELCEVSLHRCSDVGS